MTAIEQRWMRPVDVAAVAAFRIGFGLLLVLAVLRFFVHGWIGHYFEVPTHFFSYWGFAWVRPWPGPGMHLHFAAMGACALGVTLGLHYRKSVVGFGLLFAYAHLIDKTNYLNHYYLVVCLCGLMALLPLQGWWSLDVWRGACAPRPAVPAWVQGLLRAQFGIVYVFGGIAKLKPDWLFHAEPLSIWLSASSDFPLLGELLGQRWVAFAMSWAGALFDLAIVPLLLWKRSRPLAFVAVVVFHLLTARLFQLGMFPYIMIFGSLLFLPADWPRTALRWLRAPAVGSPSRSLAMATAPTRWGLGIFAAYFAVQLLLPIRHWLYPGSVCWTEQGYRFAWNVMLMEKNGSVDFRIVEPTTGRVFRAAPRGYFTPYQTKMLASQPDMILQAAHVVAEDFRRRGVQDPEVYADAFVSLNGRAMQRLIDPAVNLAREADGLGNKNWILPMNAPVMDIPRKAGSAAAASALLGRPQ